MIVTVGGQAASGKTTLAKKLAEALGYTHLSAGNVMREMAAERGESLLEFSKYAEENPEVDKEIDERQRKMAVGDCVVDGRLSRYFLKPDLSIWLVAPSIVRAERIIERGEKYASVKDAERDVHERDESERKRYLAFYEIDLGDLRVYDLVINTGTFDRDQTLDLAASAIDSLTKT